jgi:hypothetical protein
VTGRGNPTREVSVRRSVRRGSSCLTSPRTLIYVAWGEVRFLLPPVFYLKMFATKHSKHPVVVGKEVHPNVALYHDMGYSIVYGELAPRGCAPSACRSCIPTRWPICASRLTLAFRLLNFGF